MALRTTSISSIPIRVRIAGNLLMAVDVDAKDSVAEEAQPLSRLSRLWHHISVRLILLLGIVVFLTVVSIDSLQQASAAAMHTSETDLIEMSVMSRPSVQKASSGITLPLTVSEATYLDFDAEVAQRLRYSDLTRARLTRSRLTSAYLFPQRPR